MFSFDFRPPKIGSQVVKKVLAVFDFLTLCEHMSTQTKKKFCSKLARPESTLLPMQNKCIFASNVHILGSEAMKSLKPFLILLTFLKNFSRRKLSICLKKW